MSRDYNLAITRSLILFLATAAMATPLAAVTADAAARARTIAKEAYMTIDRHPFEGEVLAAAAKHLDEALALNQKEPYVYLGAAQLVLDGGYRSGSWRDASNYAPGAIDRASAFVQRAIQADSKLADAHLDAAFLALILRRFDDAKREIDLAHNLDPSAFRPVYYLAVWHWLQGSTMQCQDALRIARTLARDSRDQAMILTQLEEMAIAKGDDEQREKILKAFISLEPNDRWKHGNYGWFLLRSERYDEAIAEFEKAMSLGGYPNAKRGLEEARRARH
jgi:tetratricopeptide (TPR) repeat protein